MGCARPPRDLPVAVMLAATAFKQCSAEAELLVVTVVKSWPFESKRRMDGD